ncbi:MAG: CAP domain-containing protein [Ilumatobacteraceae bacterium]
MRIIRIVPAVIGAAFVALVGTTSVVGGALSRPRRRRAASDADRGASVQVLKHLRRRRRPRRRPRRPRSSNGPTALRAQYGLAPLVVHPQLVQSATAHSQDQAATNRACRTSGRTARRWRTGLTATGHSWRMVAENVAAGQRSAAAVTDAWANSPGHRANMLNGQLVHIGVAVAYSSSGTPYWTMVLAAPR